MSNHAHEHHHAHDMTNSHLLVQSFDYTEPATVAEAVALLTQQDGRAAVLAGGTWLLVQMKMEQAAPDCLVNIQSLPGVRGLVVQGSSLVIGGLTTIWELRNSSLVQEVCTALADACAAFGSTQIQLTGTLAGNICNGSPASDAVPALMALGAELVVVGPEGERKVSLEDFLVGPGTTALETGEILTQVQVPRPALGTGSAFVKVSRVRADLAKASAAAMIVRDEDRVVDCRLAYGAVGPTVLRGRSAEEVLVGEVFSADLALEAGQAASAEVSPIDDVRSTAAYRRQVVKALTHDVLVAAWERAGRHSSRAVAEQGRGALRKQGADENVRPLHLSAGESCTITLEVNGAAQRLDVLPNELLINVLRDRLQLTGTKYGCGIGECGACTVHLDGVPTLSCLTLAVAARGRQVTTVEGLAGPNGKLDPVQEAFIENDAFQCGYCTPGMLMMTRRLLAEHPQPDEDDIRDYLKGNRCRCTGFASIVRAVRSCVAD